MDRRLCFEDLPDLGFVGCIGSCVLHLWCMISLPRLSEASFKRQMLPFLVAVAMYPYHVPINGQEARCD